MVIRVLVLEVQRRQQDHKPGDPGGGAVERAGVEGGRVAGLVEGREEMHDDDAVHEHGEPKRGARRR